MWFGRTHFKWILFNICANFIINTKKKLKYFKIVKTSPGNITTQSCYKSTYIKFCTKYVCNMVNFSSSSHSSLLAGYAICSRLHSIFLFKMLIHFSSVINKFKHPANSWCFLELAVLILLLHKDNKDPGSFANTKF